MSDGQPSNFANYVAAMEEENDILRERVRQLEKMLGISHDVPLLFALTGREGMLFNLLMSHPIVSKEAALDHMYFDRPNDMPELKIIDVFICKIRKKLLPFGVAIDTVWGRGYSMSGASKALVKQYLAQYQSEPPAQKAEIA